MHLVRRSTFLVACALLPGAAAAQERPVPPIAADLVLHGGRVWTGVPGSAEPTGVAVLGERIVAVGADAEVLATVGPGTRVVDLAGRRVLPGFVDAHVHFLDGSAELLAPDTRGARSEEEFARRLAEAAARVPAGTWITAGAWDHEAWPGADLPRAATIDRFVPDHPVFVTRTDGHMAVANGLAMRLAGVAERAPDVPGGIVVRDASGRPTGVFKDNAMVLVGRHVPDADDATRLRLARAGLAHAARLGVTCVHSMVSDMDEVRTWQQLRAAGELTLRVRLYTPLAAEVRLRAMRLRRGFGDDWLRLLGTKGFVDGSLGSTTAWFFEPYDDAPDQTGVPVVDTTPGGTLDELLGNVVRAGLQPATHAIGDRACAALLDAYARVGGDDVRALRPRMEHAQHLRPGDLPRFAELGVVASMQPYHAIDDGRWAEGRIGARRCATTYAFRSLLDAGAVLAFGSDWPVAPLSPLVGIEAAVVRATVDGAHPDGWFPEQRITLEEALLAWTRGSAFAAFDEDRLGTLEAGKLADLVVLDADVFEVEATAIREIGIALTVVGGRVVHERGR